jgi:hypothetical protein
MHEVYLSSVKDTLLVAVPFITVLVLAIFRLDTLFWAPKKPAAPSTFRRPGCGLDASGEPVVVDPDGRPSSVRPRKKQQLASGPGLSVTKIG